MLRDKQIGPLQLKAIFQELSGNKSIKMSHLDLSKNNLTDEGLSALAEWIKEQSYIDDTETTV